MANYMTKKGYNKLLKEIVELESNDRPAVIKQIIEARDKGDLSENAEYEAAREAQGLLESKITRLKSFLLDARTIDESQIQTDSIQILNKVTLLNQKNSKKVVYTLVSDLEANLKEGKISVSTPIGKGLIGKKVGEIVQIIIPSGSVAFKILEIS